MRRTRYWTHLRELEAILPETVLLVSQDQWIQGTTAGRMVEVTRAIAARDLASGTHRLADESERASFQAEVEAKVAEAQRRAAEMRQVVYLMPSSGKESK